MVPKSHTDSSTLLSITRRSLVQGPRTWRTAVDERPVTWDEVASGTFVECGLCGTAAVISPVGEIHDDDTVVVFPGGHESSGPVMKRLRETLTGIQGGQIEDKHGWVCKIC